jgi:hypothetical protein
MASTGDEEDIEVDTELVARAWRMLKLFWIQGQEI